MRAWTAQQIKIVCRDLEALERTFLAMAGTLSGVHHWMASYGDPMAPRVESCCATLREKADAIGQIRRTLEALPRDELLEDTLPLGVEDET